MNTLIVAIRSRCSRVDSILLAVCLIVAFGFRLAVSWIQSEELTNDRDVYLATATGIVEGRGYSIPGSSEPTAFRPPVYSLCLAVGLLAFSPAFAVALINLSSGLFTVWLTASVGSWLQLGRSRFLAAMLVAVDPLLLRYSSQPMTESLCAFLTVFWLWSIVIPSSRWVGRDWLRGLVIGLTFGLLVLSRPTFWPIAGFCLIVWMIDQRRHRGDLSNDSRRSSRQTAISCVLGTAVIIVPWMVRNWLVFSTPILTTTHGGYTLLLGNNPVFYDQVIRKPWGTVWSEESLREWAAQMQEEMVRELGPHATDLQTDAWQSRQARSYIVAEPGHFIEAAIHRIRSLWNTIPQGESSESNSETLIRIVGWYYVVVLFAGLLGACLVLYHGGIDRWWPMYVLIVSVQLVHLFYWTNTRMRAPIVPAIALFAVALIPRRRSVS